jgi:uncharacterized protein (TIGR02118 family)
MVKLICFLKRRDGLTAEEFYEHWEERHAPLIASTEPFSRLVRRYEQHRRLPGAPEWAGTPGYDGVTIQWFDTLADFEAFALAPEYAEVIAPDEAAFLDTGALVWMMADEPLVPIEGPTR